VNHDREVLGEGTGKRLVDEVRRPRRFGGAFGAATDREHPLDVRRSRHEQRGERHPRRDHRPAIANQEAGGERDHSTSKSKQATIIDATEGQS
jgi:hypothetical protein